MDVSQISDLLDELESPPDWTINFIPDPNEPVTDEDSEEDEDNEDNEGRGMDRNHLGRGILSGQGEIDMADPHDILPDLTVVNTIGLTLNVVEDETMEVEDVEEGEAGPSNKRRVEEIEEGEAGPSNNREVEDMEEREAGPSNKRRRVNDVVGQKVVQLSRTKNTDREWYEEQLSRYGEKIPSFVPEPARSPVPDSCHLPYDFLRLFLCPDFIETMAVKSKLYCVTRGDPGKQDIMTADNILTSIGVMYLTRYLNPAHKLLYWEDRLDVQNLFVKNAISRNKFISVLRYTYFSEDADSDPNDAFWKVRPLISHINNKARELIEQPEWVCVDESMVRYFGPHPLKQCIREKPERYNYQ